MNLLQLTSFYEMMREEGVISGSNVLEVLQNVVLDREDVFSDSPKSDSASVDLNDLKSAMLSMLAARPTDPVKPLKMLLGDTKSADAVLAALAGISRIFIDVLRQPLLDIKASPVPIVIMMLILMMVLIVMLFHTIRIDLQSSILMGLAVISFTNMNFNSDLFYVTTMVPMAALFIMLMLKNSNNPNSTPGSRSPPSPMPYKYDLWDDVIDKLMNTSLYSTAVWICAVLLIERATPMLFMAPNFQSYVAIPMLYAIYVFWTLSECTRNNRKNPMAKMRFYGYLSVMMCEISFRNHASGWMLVIGYVYLLIDAALGLCARPAISPSKALELPAAVLLWILCTDYQRYVLLLLALPLMRSVKKTGVFAAVGVVVVMIAVWTACAGYTLDMYVISFGDFW